MTREEKRAWALSLKPGDKVVKTKYWNETPVDVLTVERLTKTGRVVTNKGTYHMSSEWDSTYKGYGNAEGTIIPATPENIQRAEEYYREEEENKKKRSVISKALEAAYDLRYGKREMTYEIAVELLELLERHKED